MTSILNNGKYEINDGRHYENPYDEYSATNDDEIIDRKKNEIHEAFKKKLIKRLMELVEELERNKRAWYNRKDCSIYTGNAGIAQMFYLLGKTLKKQSYIEMAEELIEQSMIDAKGDKRISYLAGSPGPLALGAVVHHASGNEMKSMEMISRLKSLTKSALNETSNELLYGKTGYLYALLFINANISSRPIEEELIKQIVERILNDGREYSKANKYDTSLMYQWHEKEYIGGAHGLAGILYVLIQAREYLTEEQLQQDVKPALHYLQKIRFPSGNFPSSIGNQSDRLVHWCHGAPSMTMLFTLAYQIFKEESFLEVAIECGEVVWARGILRKGYSLCHGVSGNAYTFITLYQQTGDTKYLYKACKFSEWCMNWGECADRIPDRPYSLFEGLAGTIYFLADLSEPKLAKFPGYTL